jgi:hypothetical protein
VVANIRNVVVAGITLKMLVAMLIIQSSVVAVLAIFLATAIIASLLKDYI